MTVPTSSRGADEADDASESAVFCQLNDGLPDRDRLATEAALWLARRQDGLTADEQAELDAWLAGDPARASKFEQFEGLWRQLDQLAPDDIAAFKVGQPASLGAPPPSAARQAAPQPAPIHVRSGGPGRRALSVGRPGPRQPIPHRRRLVTQAAALAVAGLVLGSAWLGWDYWQQQPVFAERFVTSRGQQLSVTLPEGSGLRLDTATRVEVSLHRHQHVVTLPQGQALFDVKPDPARPFVVRAGPVQITVLGTRFSARRTEAGLDAGHVRVVVEEGRVRLTRAPDAVGAVGSSDAGSAAAGKDADGPQRAAAVPSDGRAESLELTAGQAVVADAWGHFGPVTLAALGSALAWRDGRVVLDDTPLDQAVAEFERHLDTGLVVSDPVVARLRLNGSFDPRQINAFKRSLVRALPVQLQTRSDGRTEIVAAR